MTEHTNWTVGKPQKFHNQHYTPIEEPLMGELMTDICWVVSGEDAARFIVTACNCHADLLEALRTVSLDGDGRTWAAGVAIEAIRKAEEQSQ